jgi:tetratricopeptide (TPR) repeat protein
MGTYYKEKKEYNKSIACFLRAANIRGSKGGDCYFNLGILYYLQRKSDVAIKMF